MVFISVLFLNSTVVPHKLLSGIPPGKVGGSIEMAFVGLVEVEALEGLEVGGRVVGGMEGCGINSG